MIPFVHLKIRQSLPTGEIPLLCQSCLKAFKLLFHLKSHKSVLLGEILVNCQRFCSFVYRKINIFSIYFSYRKINIFLICFSYRKINVFLIYFPYRKIKIFSICFSFRKINIFQIQSDEWYYVQYTCMFVRSFEYQKMNTFDSFRSLIK